MHTTDKMRSLFLLALCIALAFTSCNLCGRWCNRGSCSSASDGCTECGPDCGPYGCGTWYCRHPTSFEDNLEICLEHCLELLQAKEHEALTLQDCKTRCTQIIQEEYIAQNATRNTLEDDAPRVDCNICNLDCSGPNDPWCSQTASGPIICGTCVYVSDYGGSGYLCQHT